jgi:hypothetical protein
MKDRMMTTKAPRTEKVRERSLSGVDILEYNFVCNLGCIDFEHDEASSTLVESGKENTVSEESRVV